MDSYTITTIVMGIVTVAYFYGYYQGKHRGSMEATGAMMEWCKMKAGSIQFNAWLEEDSVDVE